MKYGQILKKLRNNAGLSQQELADRLDLNRATYARYETSSSEPDYATLQCLADYFSVTIDSLLGRDIQQCNTLIKNEELKEWYLKLGQEVSEADLEDLKLFYDTFIVKKHALKK